MEKNMKKKSNIIIFLVLVVLGIISRLLPHPANFAPVGAIALFGGFYFKDKWKVLAPLAILFISDAVLGFYDYKLMFTVYFCIFLNSVIGSYIKNNKIMLKAVSFSFLGSVVFFIVTNFAVWEFTNWYSQTIAGLINCYIMALPFFLNSILGDLFYTFTIFGAYELAKNFELFKQSRIIKKITN